MDTVSGGVTRAPSSSRVVTLNVGGTRYQTTLDTLIRYEGLLATMFSGAFGDGATDDEPFIDYDPSVFAVVLTFARTGLVVVPDLVEWRAVSAAFSYFFFSPEIIAQIPSTRRSYRFGETHAYATVAGWADQMNAFMRQFAEHAATARAAGQRSASVHSELRIEPSVGAENWYTVKATVDVTWCAHFHMAVRLLRPQDHDVVMRAFLCNRRSFDDYAFKQATGAFARNGASPIVPEDMPGMVVSNPVHNGVMRSYVVFPWTPSADDASVRRHVPAHLQFQVGGEMYAPVDDVRTAVDELQLTAAALVKNTDSTARYAEVVTFRYVDDDGDRNAWSLLEVADALAPLFMSALTSVCVELSHAPPYTNELADAHMFPSKFRELRMFWSCKIGGAASAATSSEKRMHDAV